MQKGLWNRIIKDKYIPFISVACWLRTMNVVNAKGSNTWKHLLKSLHILLHWVAWRPGTRHSILVGRDHILGMGEGAILSEEMIIAINRKGVHYLYQVHCEPCVGMIGLNWLSSNDLGLEDDLSLEWKFFHRSLINVGVLLLEKMDELIWLGGDVSSQIIVKNAFVAMEKKRWKYVIGGWRKALWS
jgi:hypothetical protein